MERCAQCGVKLLEDENGVTAYWALGVVVFCSHECVMGYKEEVVRSGKSHPPL